MPPVMGAGAFLLAQLTETSYLDVIKIALIPAILYYLSVACIVYLRAVRRGLHGVSEDELPPWSAITPRLALLLPIPVMVYYLVIGDSAFLAAVKTIFLIVLLLFGRRMVTPTALGGILHYVYGLLPILLFLFAHIIARSGNARLDRKSTRLNSSHMSESRMPSSA